MKNEKGSLYLNRFVAFLVGAVAMFAVMSFTVVSTAKKETAELSASLDKSQYEAGRLLAAAKEQFIALNYTAAKASLATLSDKQAGSPEAEEGKTLLVSIESAEKTSNEKWEAAMAGLKAKWQADRAVELRSAADTTRAQVEKDLQSNLDQEWERAMERVRSDWESGNKS